MDKTLQEMQIEVARYWAGVEEMKDCEWSLVEIEGPGLQIVNAEWFFASNLHSPTTKRKYYGPYLKIEDGNPWSSAEFFRRCGKESQSVVKFLGLINHSKHKGDLFNKETYLIWSAMEGELLRSWRAGNLVLYYNIGLQWLHKYAPEVWAKGMELCD